MLRSNVKPTDMNLATIYDVVSVQYDTQLPWPEMADNRGYSIVPIDDSGYFDHDDPLNWRASTQRNGSPGIQDPPSKVPPLVISEVLAYPDLTGSSADNADYVEIYNPTSAAVLLDYWSITDRLSNITRFEFPAGTGTLAAGGYRAVKADELGFGLSLLGDKVFLVSGSGPGELNRTSYVHGLLFEASAPLKPWGRVRANRAQNCPFVRACL